LIASRNVELDKNLKVEEIIDGKQEKINQLEKELVRARDEAMLRREVIDSMSANMMKHEKENRELVSKLVMMKNQMLEQEINDEINHRFGAVKVFHVGLKPGSKVPPPIAVSVGIKDLIGLWYS
jgi:superoxide dismutase